MTKRVHLLAGILAVLVASYAAADIPPIMPPPVTGLPLSVDSLTVTNAASVGGALTATGGITASSVSANGTIVARGMADAYDGTLKFGVTPVTVLEGNGSGSLLTINGGGYSNLALGNSPVGIGTASPATTLDVNGSAQFGSGATKSTFTATGDLQIAGGTLTTSSGILSVPSQPGGQVRTSGALTIPNNYDTIIYYDTVDRDQNDTFRSVTSSYTFVARGAGFYSGVCHTRWAANATGVRNITLRDNGGNVYYNDSEPALTTGGGNSLNLPYRLYLTDGQTVQCEVYQNSGGPLNMNFSIFTFHKDD